MLRMTLTESEVEAVRALAAETACHYRKRRDLTEHLRYTSVLAHELPRRLRAFVTDFKLGDVENVCIVSGYPIDSEKIGRTPSHWKFTSDEAVAAREEESVLLLVGSLLGDVFGWATQQDGHVVHDVLPIKGHEHEQLGSGSEELLWWHTEDAFHPFSGDYVGLMCLRNPDNVPTTIGRLDVSALTDDERRVLSSQRFTIRPDESHLSKNQFDVARGNGDADKLDAAYARINEMNTEPTRISILFGGADSSYLRIDPYFMDIDKLDEESRQALERAVAVIDASLMPVALQPGDICLIDNLHAVHGRMPFTARHDGNDRWLKRINVTRDLRKSRASRASAETRIIF